MTFSEIRLYKSIPSYFPNVTGRKFKACYFQYLFSFQLFRVESHSFFIQYTEILSEMFYNIQNPDQVSAVLYTDNIQYIQYMLVFLMQ